MLRQTPLLAGGIQEGPLNMTVALKRQLLRYAYSLRDREQRIRIVGLVQSVVTVDG